MLLLGRDGERAEVGALLDAARASRSGALVLRGEAGVGKTALLEDARERAADMHVLGARGVESELEAATTTSPRSPRARSAARSRTTSCATWTAWDRGAATTVDVVAADWDFWNAVATPLEELRAAYGVPPVDPALVAERSSITRIDPP